MLWVVTGLMRCLAHCITQELKKGEAWSKEQTVTTSVRSPALHHNKHQHNPKVSYLTTLISKERLKNKMLRTSIITEHWQIKR